MSPSSRRTNSRVSSRTLSRSVSCWISSLRRLTRSLFARSIGLSPAKHSVGRILYNPEGLAVNRGFSGFVGWIAMRVRRKEGG